MELPKDGKLSLLDFTISIDNGESQFSFYKKPERKETWPHFKSAVPTASKQAFIRNKRNRITERCSDTNVKKAEIKRFNQMLSRRGYPAELLIKKAPRRRPQKRSNDVTFFHFPFYGDRINNKVNGIFRSVGLPVRAFSRNYTLRNALNKRDEFKNCSLEGCRINDPKKCFTKNCVYLCVCEGCGDRYIGSTARCLHIRIREHFKSENSAIFQHRRRCRAEFTTQVIDRANDVINTRLKEAIVIKRRKPELNSRSEHEEFTDILNL